MNETSKKQANTTREANRNNNTAAQRKPTTATATADILDLTVSGAFQRATTTEVAIRRRSTVNVNPSLTRERPKDT
jgi:hypothetical protein